MTFYLLDRVSDQIKASYPRLNGVSTQGFRVVDVPDNLAIQEDVDGFTADNLRDQKYAALLASAPRYSYVYYDDLVDASLWDLTAPNTVGAVGESATFLPPTSGLLQSDTIDVSSDGLFDDFAIYWDLYTLTRTQTGQTSQVSYTRADPDLVEVFISNDDGSSFTQTASMLPTSLAGQGGLLKIRFRNTTSTRYYLGAVAILY